MFIGFKTEGSHMLINDQHIVALEKDGSGTVIHTVRGDYTVEQSIEAIIEQLS